MASAILRIKNDLKDINYDDYNEYIAYAELQKGHPLTVEACLIGPRSTAYEDVIFIVKIQFPDNYPVKKQKLFFINLFIYYFVEFTTYNYMHGRNKLS
jgi:ubiquitin-protein ligase